MDFKQLPVHSAMLSKLQTRNNFNMTQEISLYEARKIYAEQL
jgi:hypothetical protein